MYFFLLSRYMKIGQDLVMLFNGVNQDFVQNKKLKKGRKTALFVMKYCLQILKCLSGNQENDLYTFIYRAIGNITNHVWIIGNHVLDPLIPGLALFWHAAATGKHHS